jgi:hypothetical protein
VLPIVDQPNTIGALPVAVARATGCGVAYLPGLAMRKYPGHAKTDPRDAFINADTAYNDEVLSVSNIHIAGDGV